MKHFGMLCCIFLLCLILAGCRRIDNPLPQEMLAAEQPAEIPEETPAEEPTEKPADQPVSGDLTTGLYEASGKLRLPYTGNRSSVQYVTSVEQLPDEEAFAQYDEAYFEKHALLLVIETVGSGSVQVGIEAVDPVGCTVTLSHHMPGNVGTTDMATWLLWIEVEPGLTDAWTVTNPALKSDSKTA